jgi:hypothetical protein
VQAGYPAPEGTLMLVRPDGYLGLVAERGTAQGVADYWAALHGEPAPGAVSGAGAVLPA